MLAAIDVILIVLALFLAYTALLTVLRTRKTLPAGARQN
jgi:biopolymer transport protein ExbD